MEEKRAFQLENREMFEALMEQSSVSTQIHTMNRKQTFVKLSRLWPLKLVRALFVFLFLLFSYINVSAQDGDTAINSKPKIDLTPQEQAWLAQNHTVRVHISSYPPYMLLGDGEPAGISIDYIRLIAEKTGINIVFTDEAKGDGVAIKRMEKLQGPDLILCMNRNSESEGKISFSESYISSPMVIFTQKEVAFISGMDDLQGKKVAIMRKRGEEFAKYPDIDLNLYQYELQGLEALSTGQVDAYIGPLTRASFLILEHGVSGVKVAAPISSKNEDLSFGNRHDWPELTRIIDKVLNTITPSERSAIQSKYLSVRYEYGLSPTEILKQFLTWGSIATLILIGFLVWNRRLNQKFIKRTSELTNSEKRFKSTFEQAAVGIAHVSPNGAFLRINQKFCEIVGCSIKEMQTHTFQEITHPDDLESDIQQVNLLLKGEKESYSIEKRYFHKKGHIVWVNLTVSLVKDSSGDPLYFVSVVENIDARKKAEDALQESKDLLRITEEKAQIGQYSGDFITKKGVWSDEQYRMFGYYPGEIEPSMEITHNHVHPEDRDKWLKANQDHIQKDIPYHLEYRIIRKDGAVRTILAWSTLKRNDDGSPIRTVGITQDITDRKQAEEERSLLFDLSPDLMSITSFDGISTLMNPSWATTMGYTSEELLAVPFFNLLHPDDKQKTIDEIEKISKGGYNSNNFENRYIHKNGSILHVSWKATALVEQNLMFSIGRDITEKKKVEKQFAEYQKRLKALTSELTIIEEKQRKQIATDLHDQVGQLLAASRIQLATITDKMSMEEILAKKNYISKGMVEAIKATRHAIFELSPPQLNEIGLVAAISDWIDAEIDGKYKIKVNIKGENKIFPVTENIRLSVFRWVRELLFNIVKHAHASQVTITIQEEHESLIVTVSDDGKGFKYSPAMLRQEGSGFGLFSIQERIDNLGGSMKVKSAPRKGTLVILTVPLINN